MVQVEHMQFGLAMSLTIEFVFTGNNCREWESNCKYTQKEVTWSLADQIVEELLLLRLKFCIPSFLIVLQELLEVLGVHGHMFISFTFFILNLFFSIFDFKGNSISLFFLPSMEMQIKCH